MRAGSIMTENQYYESTFSLGDDGSTRFFAKCPRCKEGMEYVLSDYAVRNGVVFLTGLSMTGDPENDSKQFALKNDHSCVSEEIEEKERRRCRK